MKLVGLTGGIACGKSTVSSLLGKEFGIEVIDCDEIARRVVQKVGFCHLMLSMRSFALDRALFAVPFYLSLFYSSFSTNLGLFLILFPRSLSSCHCSSGTMGI